MIPVEAHWSLGVLIGLPLLSLLVVGLLLATAVLLYFGFFKDVDDPFVQFMLAGFTGVPGLIIAVLMAFGYWPYTAEYHQWRPVQGTVTHVDSRIIGADSGVSQRFVVQFAGSDVAYGCDDTRCATVHPGDVLALSCKREWEWAANSGYGCRWVDVRRPGA
jgi:hypothetical protein